jgi:large subunit ribosomal protein L25
MADRITLAAEPRTVVGKQVRGLRRKGVVPVVLYGHKREPLALQIEERALRKTLKQAGGYHLVELNFGGEPHLSLAREVQQHPITRAILHADFQEVVMNEKVVLSVPLHFVGDAPAVKAGLGLLIHTRESVQLEALPGDLINSIAVDVSALEAAGQAVHVSDLRVPASVRIMTDPHETVARIQAMKEEVLTEVAAEEVTAEVELIKKDKPLTDEDEEAGEEK